MDVTQINISDAYESPTNPRGTDFAPKAFADLVASIKEKGVLLPLIVRKNPSHGKTYEVVAGNRRLRASHEAGLKQVPAIVKTLSDDEAREEQIIENLQREDVHPIEEGQAYRQLIEGSNLKISDLAIRVGKSETYIRHRLFLTNLIGKAQKMFRSGEITDGHAVLIAKLSEADQASAVKWIQEEYDTPTVADLKEWIAKTVSDSLAFQPWLKDKALAQVMPDHLSGCGAPANGLFGDVKQGQCTDLKCWTKRIQAFIEHERELVPELVPITLTYGSDTAEFVSRSNYELLEGKKSGCDFKETGIVVDGRGLGTTHTICRSRDCEKHHTSSSFSSNYRPTKEEREKRKKELEKEKAKAEKKYQAFVDRIEAKVSWPLSEANLDLLLTDAISSHGVTSLTPVAKRLGFKPTKEKNSWGSETNSYKPPLRDWLSKASPVQKLRMLFELRGVDNKAFKSL